MLKVVDLFSGIGGFSLGLENTGGFETVAFCEREPFCQAVLRKHWPDVPIYDDIRELDADAIGPVHVVTGGFPCQPWSIAGKRRGTDDDRDLWPEMLRVVDQARPDWVVGENVAGLASMAFERMFLGVESRTGGRHPGGIDYTSVSVRQERMQLGRICGDLGALGYDATVLEIPACAVDAPHRRARLWIVAHCAWDGGRSSATGRADRERVGTGGDADRLEYAGRTGRSDGERRDADGVGTRNGTLDGSSWGNAALLGGQRVKPGLRLLAHGIPGRVAKLRAFGNAVVPDVVEEIGYAMLAAGAP